MELIEYWPRGNCSADNSVLTRVEAAQSVLACVADSHAAYHSHHMQSFAAQYQERLENTCVGFQCGPAHCQMFSSVTGLTTEPSELIPSYWVKNMTSTVKFSAALERCMEHLPVPLDFSKSVRTRVVWDKHCKCSKRWAETTLNIFKL